MDGPQHRLALVQQADQRAEQRAAAGKRDGAVDRVEHPHEFRPVVLRPEFLPNDAVMWVMPTDQLPHHRLRLAVGPRHRAAVALELHV